MHSTKDHVLDSNPESYTKLLAQRQELDKKIEMVRKVERASIIESIKKQINDYDLTAGELGLSGGKGRKTRQQQGSVSPKYQDPSTGAKWSGRGKAPKWIANKPREQFLIQ